METRQYTDQEGHVFVVSWSRVDARLRNAEPYYNVWVTMDGEEIDFTPNVDSDFIRETVRNYRQRCQGREEEQNGNS